MIPVAPEYCRKHNVLKPIAIAKYAWSYTAITDAAAYTWLVPFATETATSTVGTTVAIRTGLKNATTSMD